jgi:hypothetical protein
MEPLTPRAGEPPSFAPDRFSPRPGDPSAAVPPGDPGEGPRPLPAEIVLPTERTFRAYYDPWAYGQMVLYVVNLAKGLAHDRWRLDGEVPAAPHAARAFPPIKVDPSVKTVVRESEDLKPIDWSSFPILVDGTEVCIDFGDWNIVRAGAADHAHWLRLQFHSSYKAYPWMGAFPAATFKDWDYYDRVQTGVRRARKGLREPTIVLNNQDVAGVHDSRVRRRFMVRGMLDYHFGDRVDFAWTTPEAWHGKAAHALCYVQVPGSWENIMDKGQLQMIGLGLPTISPILYQQCCDGLLQPGIHYLACRQDFRDLPDLIRWLETHPDEAAGMGHNAWLFFQEFCTPMAVWSYVKDRIDHGSRPSRATIDTDLCPPGLYAS